MFDSDIEFEDECRRIARLLWPSAEFSGAVMVDQRERDGVFETVEFVHCLECTTSKSKRKAEEDCAKLDRIIRKYRAKYPDRFLKGWFVTLYEPTAEQRTVAERHRPHVVACSFEQFRSRLVNAHSYLDARRRYAFGSVRDPKTGAPSADLAYIDIELLDDGGGTHSVETVVDALTAGKAVVLTGDYGAGKSSTARECFLVLAKRFWRSESKRFPILLNLRDHHGQVDPVEAIERHARSVGFADPASLVRAWRAGYCTPILDGFDEVASAGWAGSIKRLRDLRYRSMELLRQFVRHTDASAGMLITGRQHFFDSERELSTALAVHQSALRLRLSELSADDVRTILVAFGWQGNVPEWLPTRPLLLSYLASSGLVSGLATDDAVTTPAAGWNALLDRISHREAEIEAGLDPGTVRSLIERIATRARSTLDGLGPLSPELITESFREVCGYAPDDRGMVLLQRLPGLGGTSSEDGSRVFVDRDFAEAARAGDVVRFVEQPYNAAFPIQGWQSMLRELGAQVAALGIASRGIPEGRIHAAMMHAIESFDEHTLAGDVLATLGQFGGRVERPCFLKGVAADEIAFSPDLGLEHVEFQDSVFGYADFRLTGVSELPTFRRCVFGRIDGAVSNAQLSGHLLDCAVSEFESAAQTTDALLQLHIPLSTRVLLTVIKKLFAQSGRGRQEAALYRGLDHKAQNFVPDILELLRREGFIVRCRQGSTTTWLPAKTAGIRRRALEMLSENVASKDPVLLQSRDVA